MLKWSQLRLYLPAVDTLTGNIYIKIDANRTLRVGQSQVTPLAHHFNTAQSEQEESRFAPYIGITSQERQALIHKTPRTYLAPDIPAPRIKTLEQNEQDLELMYQLAYAYCRDTAELPQYIAEWRDRVYGETISEEASPPRSVEARLEPATPR